MALVRLRDIGITDDDTTPTSDQWTHVLIGDDRIISRLGARSIWIEGGRRIADTVFAKRFGLELDTMYCPCQRCSELITISELHLGQRYTIEDITRHLRNAMIDRDGREVRSNPPRRYNSTPTSRSDFFASSPMRDIATFMQVGHLHLFFVKEYPTPPIDEDAPPPF